MVGRLKKHSKSQGGVIIFAFKSAQFLCCLALFSLLLTIIVEESGHRNLELTGIFEVNVSELAVAITFVCCRTFFVQACLWFHLNFKWYSSFLAFASLTSGSWSRLMTQHNNLVLLTTFGVYAYRDIWPLATYLHGPVDISEGPLLWVKLGLLTLVAVVIPLFIPRQYIPVDPKVRVLRPYFRIPHIDRVHRILWKYHSFLDPVIFEAYRVPHLSHERLPPLADYDYAKRLTEHAFPVSKIFNVFFSHLNFLKHLDLFHGAKKRHPFFGLVKIFCKNASSLKRFVEYNLPSSLGIPGNVFEHHRNGFC